MPISATQTDFLLQPGNRPQDAGRRISIAKPSLKLLVAQLKHQDPLEPMEDVEFIGQLTRFSNLEQVMKTNTKLDELSMATGAQVSVPSDQHGRPNGRDPERSADA